MLLCIPILAQATVKVDINGNGDYTSFTQAMYETTDNVIVYPGTYDIHQEYLDYFGDIAENMTDNTDLNLF